MRAATSVAPMGEWSDRRAMAAVLAALAGGMLALCGCARPMGRPPEPRPPVVEPPELLSRHNAWAESIQTVWSRADLKMNLPAGEAGEKRERHAVSGHLFLAKPGRLFVHGQVLGQEVFQFGVGGERFWLWVRPQVNTVWVGRRGGQAEADLIISPPALLEALGLSRIEPRPGTEMHVDAYGDHFVLSEYGGGWWPPVRRTWLDRRTFRPRRIDLFDPDGRRVLMSELLEYSEVEGTDVCTLYRVRFLPRGAGGGGEVDLVIHLKDVSLEKAPNPRVFEYRRPPGATEEDLDRPRSRAVSLRVERP